MDSFREHQRMYIGQHQTLGCRVTHMFGIPLIALSVPLFFFAWKVSLALFICGWILQFVGHYVFEKNTPVFLGNPFDINTYLVALAFAADEWLRFFTGKPLVDPASKA